MRTCFFQKQSPQKGVQKTKKVSIKKNIRKKWKTYFFKKQTKVIVFKRAKKVFVFVKKKYFSQKKRVFKLSVFENNK
jgi:hypothetical protein